MGVGHTWSDLVTNHVVRTVSKVLCLMSLLTSRCCFALPAAVAASRNHTSLQLLLHAMALGAGRPSASSLHDSDPHTVSKAVCPRPPTHPLTHPRRNQMASYLGVTSSSSRQPSSSYWQHKTSWPCAAESVTVGRHNSACAVVMMMPFFLIVHLKLQGLR